MGGRVNDTEEEIEHKAEKMLQRIYDESQPNRMTVSEARQYYIELISRIESQLNALEDE